MNKIVIIAVLLVVIGGGVFIFTSDTVNTPDTFMPNETNTGDQNQAAGTQPEGSETATGTNLVGGDAQVDTDADTTKKSFSVVYDERYGFNPRELRVQEGDTVTIDLRSAQGSGSFIIDAYGVELEASEEEEENPSFEFEATERGQYEFYNRTDNEDQQYQGMLIVE